MLRKRVVAAALVGGLGCVGALFYGPDAREWYRNVTTSDDTAGLYYPSAKFMAEQVGCLDTFHTPRMPGSSESAGECDLPNGAHIQFRTFTTEGQSFAWLDGARGQSGRLEEAGAGGVGKNWAILITGTTDREAISDVFQSLPG